MPAERSLGAERTSLAWQRSSLSLSVVATLLLVHAVRPFDALRFGGAAAVAAAALWSWCCGGGLYHRRLASPQTVAARPLLGLAAVTVGAAAVACAEVVSRV